MTIMEELQNKPSQIEAEMNRIESFMVSTPDVDMTSISRNSIPIESVLDNMEEYSNDVNHLGYYVGKTLFIQQFAENHSKKYKGSTVPYTFKFFCENKTRVLTTTSKCIVKAFEALKDVAVDSNGIYSFADGKCLKVRLDSENYRGKLVHFCFRNGDDNHVGPS